MRIEMNVPDHPRALNGALEGLTRVNVAQLLGLAALGKRPPLLYQSGVRYGEEPPGREWWQTVVDNLGEVGKSPSHTDCEDIAAHRTAELRVLPIYFCPAPLLPAVARALNSGAMQGIPARTICVRTGTRVYHAVTQWPDGRIEDPSRVLGMRPKRRL